MISIKKINDYYNFITSKKENKIKNVYCNNLYIV